MLPFEMKRIEIDFEVRAEADLKVHQDGVKHVKFTRVRKCRKLCETKAHINSLI